MERKVSSPHSLRALKDRIVFLALAMFCLHYSPNASLASSIIEIQSGSSDSQVCFLIERAHRQGLDLWGAGRPADALPRFRACEDALKKRALWMPPKLPAEPSPDQRRAWNVTNSVIFSLAAIHQKLGRRAESERYAEMARERGLLPKVFQGGRKSR